MKRKIMKREKDIKKKENRIDEIYQTRKIDTSIINAKFLFLHGAVFEGVNVCLGWSR